MTNKTPEISELEGHPLVRILLLYAVMKTDTSKLLGIEKFYDQSAKKYDQWANAFETKAKAKMLELAHVKNGISFLDVGVGTGHLFIDVAFVNIQGRNCGLDISAKMIAELKQKCNSKNLKAELVKGSAYELQDFENQFDLCISSYMFEMLPKNDYLHVVAGMVKALRPGGRIILAGTVEKEGILYLPAKLLCRRHPEWEGGFHINHMIDTLKSFGLENVQSHLSVQNLIPTGIVTAEIGK